MRLSSTAKTWSSSSIDAMCSEVTEKPKEGRDKRTDEEERDNWQIEKT